jgi:hypothetical protein
MRRQAGIHLRTNPTVLRWIMQAKPPAIRDGIANAAEEEDADRCSGQ